nr:DUF4388 domain-containing protein [Aetokthonos hydrillicola CCALA 1050]
MQGNLHEIDIASILQLISLGQRTGVLFVEAYSGNRKWGMGHGAWGMGHWAWGMGHGSFVM